MRHALLTWTDRGGDRPPAGARAADRSSDLGPVLRLLDQPESAGRYGCVWVLTSAKAQAPTRALVAELGRRVERVELRVLELPDPSDYALLFQALGPLCQEVRRQHRPGSWSLDVLLSAGTPQAQTLWVILVQAGLLPARMLQVIPPQFVPVPHRQAVREVRLDIDGFPEIRALRTEVKRLRAAARSPRERTILIGESEAMRELRVRIARIGRAQVTVLVQGETGTGKELVASALHQASDVSDGPFVAENCGAFAEGVLASELFGHESGAFTGAAARHRGLFEQAHGGTLFLDEVGELPLRVQAMLLRVLQDGVLRRVGGDEPVQVRVRVIAATHRDLKAMVAAGEFRQDLYYRLCGATLEMPPLRARIADLPLLIESFLDEAKGPARPRPSSEVLRQLARYAWPGNVRELRAEVQRWTVFCDDEVQLADLSPELRSADSAPPGTAHSSVSSAAQTAPESPAQPLAEVLAAAEESAIRSALAAQKDNLLRTARSLGIDRNTLKRKLRTYGMYPIPGPVPRPAPRPTRG